MVMLWGLKSFYEQHIQGERTKKMVMVVFLFPECSFYHCPFCTYPLILPRQHPLEHLHPPPNPETKTHFVKICRSHNGRGCPFSVTWPRRSRRRGRCVLTRKSEIALTSGKTKRSFKCPYELWRQSLFIWVDPKMGSFHGWTIEWTRIPIIRKMVKSLRKRSFSLGFFDIAYFWRSLELFWRACGQIRSSGNEEPPPSTIYKYFLLLVFFLA